MTLAALGIACGDPGTCPTPTDAAATVEGRYYTVSDGERRAGAGPFPSYTTSSPQSIEVDREAGVARIRYVHDGRVIVEEWAITGSEVR